MPSKAQSVPIGLRFGIFLVAVGLTFLFSWLLGFVLDDLGSITGPQRSQIEARHVDAALVKRAATLGRQIEDLNRRGKRQSEIQRELKESMHNARGTMEQMMKLHRMALEQQAPPSDAEKQALAAAQQRFIAAQEAFETANTDIAAASEQRFTLERQERDTQEEIARQKQPAEAEYREAVQRHRLRLASIRLAVIVPLFLLAVYAVFRCRRSAYRLLPITLLIAAGWKLVIVMFEHFPRDYFKYIAIVAGIGVGVWFLTWLVRKAVRPNPDLLLRRRRESYRRHLCPTCSFPIQRGSLREATWGRKGPKAGRLTQLSADQEDPGPYDCPSCGTRLFESCPKCHAQRHSRLPHCSSCGDFFPAWTDYGPTSGDSTPTDEPAQA